MTVGHPRLPLPGVVALGAFQVGASFLAARGQPERADLDVWAVLLLLTGPASFLLGRRWPFVPVVVSATAASVFIGLGYPFGPIFAGVGISMFLAIQTGRRREVLAFAPLAVAGLALATELDERGDGFRWPHMLIAAGWMIAILAVSEIVRAQREQRAERRRADEAARERRLADERMRLAQELHDVLAHNISLINVQASTALHLLDQQPERAAEALANVKRASADALGELRVALDVLRDSESPRAPAPKLAELEALVEGVRAGGLAVTLTAEEVPARLASTVELAAYRIVQEALTNVTRHSLARAVTVRVAGDGDALTVEIVDDGHGAHLPATSNGRGLVGMRERAASLGGTFEAGPTPSGGFRVAARLPVSGR